MARLTQELNGLMNRTAERVRKKKIVGQGKDSSVKRGNEAMNGPTDNFSFGGAHAVAETTKKDERTTYMKKRVAEKNEVQRDPERAKQQKEKNRQALRNIEMELKLSKAGNMAPDRGSIMDFEQDYVATDNELGQAARKAQNRQKAKQFYRNRQRNK